MKADNKKTKQKNPRFRSLPKMNLVLMVSLVFIIGYLIYSNFIANASVTGNKYLTVNGSAVNDAAIRANSYTATTNTTNDNIRFEISEVGTGVGRLAWNFTGWQPFTEVSDTNKGSKVTKVTITMEASMVQDSSTGNAGDKTIKFSMRNVTNGLYDLDTTVTRRLNSTTDALFTLEFPKVNYSNYFNPDGTFAIQMFDTVDGYTGGNDRIRIDFMYVNIEYDNTAPIATWSSPSGNPTPHYTNSSTVNLVANGTDNSDAQQAGISEMKFFQGAEVFLGSDFVRDSGTNTNGTWSYVWSPAEGTYTVYARAYDAASNVSSATTAQTIVVDRTVPTLNLEYYSDLALTQPLQSENNKVYARGGTTVYVKLVPNETLRNNAGDNQITIDAPGTLSDVTNGNFTWTGSAWRYDWTVNSGSAGETTSITVKGTDLAGNVRTGSPGSGNKAVIDTTAPTLSLEYYQDANLNTPLLIHSGRPVAKAGTVFIKIVGNETLSTIAGDHKITIDAPGTANDINNQNFVWDGLIGAWKFAWNISSGNDGNTLSISVTGKDLAGNTTTGAPSSGSSATIDTIAPSASITAPSSNGLIKGTVNITGTASDSATFDYYKLEYAPTGGASWIQIGSNQTASVTNGTLLSWNTIGVSDGYYDMRLTVYDKGGNSQTSTVTNLQIDNVAPVLNLEYYSNSTLTQRLHSLNGKPQVTAGSVYIKLVADEPLRSNAGDNQITINAPGTVNDVTNANFTWTGSAWVYTWTVSTGNDGDTLSITVKGTSLSGNVRTGFPTSGGTVTIDNTILTPSLTYIAGGGRFTLEWSVEPDHHKYFLYRSTISGFIPDGFNLFATINAPIDTYTDLFPIDINYYRIVAVDKAGNTSQASPQIKVYQTDKAL
ncbi:MAG: hypothetical protein ACYDG6_13440, partial [Thermincolia bacterium]